MSNQSFTYGIDQDLTPNAYSKAYTVSYTTAHSSVSPTTENTNASYDFAGWDADDNGVADYEDEEEVGNLTTTKNATVTLKALWTGGSVTLPSVASNSADGYTFDGWYDGDTKVSSPYTPGKNVTLTAHWTANTGNTISYETNGGTIHDASYPSTYTTGTTPALPSDVRKTGYTFAGWYRDSELTDGPVTNVSSSDYGAKTFYADWTPNTYTVEFAANGGSGTMADQDFTYDAAATALRTNTFTKTYTVEYNANGGTISPALTTANTTANYSFDGWSGSDGESYTDGQAVRNLTATNGATITMTAQWLDDGTVTLPSVTNGTMTFDGWYNGDTYVGKTGTVTVGAGVTLTAHWSQANVNVIYHADNKVDASDLPGTNGVVSVTIGSTYYPVTANIDVVTGGTVLLGWTTSQVDQATAMSVTDGTVSNVVKTSSDAITVNNNINLYPVVAYAVNLAAGPECWVSAAGFPRTVAATVYKYSGTPLTLLTTASSIQSFLTTYYTGDPQQYLKNKWLSPELESDDQRRDHNITVNGETVYVNGFMEWNTSYNSTSNHGNGKSYWNSYTDDADATLYAMYGYPICYDAGEGGVFRYQFGDSFENGTSLGQYYYTYVADYYMPGENENGNKGYNAYRYVMPDGVSALDGVPVFDASGNQTALTGGKIKAIRAGYTQELNRIDSSASFTPAFALLYDSNVFWTPETASHYLTIPVESWPANHVLMIQNPGAGRQWSVHFKAMWDKNIIYYANNGSGSSSEDVIQGNFSEGATFGTYHSYTAKAAETLGFTKAGYTFSGWKTAPSSGTSYSAGAELNNVSGAPIELYAQWTLNTYTVSYNSNGGSGDIADATKTHGETLTLSNGSGFTGPQVTVTFNGNGAGSTVSTASASAYRTIARWDTAAAGNGTSYALSGSYTNNAALDLYAQWSAVTVDFSDTLTYTASRDGYTFDGWYTLAEGGYEVTSHEFAAANTGGSFEVFAHWTASNVSVTFDMGEHGVAPVSQSGAPGFSFEKPTDPTVDGYIFLGWYDSTLTVPYTFPLVINADTILYAKWVKIERTLALTSAIDVYFMIPQSAFGAGKLDASTAKFTVNYVNRNGTGRSNATITAKSSATVDAVKYYVWVFSELNPAHLGENLEITFYEGETEKATLNYSVIEYCYNQIDEYEKDKTAAKLKTAKICAGIVRYGVAAETYALAAHGIKVFETSASAGFAALNSATEYNYNSTSYDPTSVDNKSNVAKKIGSDASGFTGFEWVSGALDLGHNVRIKLNFTYTGADASNYSVKVKYKTGGSTVTEDLGCLEDLDGAVYYDNFNPSEFGRTLQFAVYNSSGTRVSKVLQYSVYSYLLTASGKTGNIKTLADTLINYGDAVYRFVNGESD